jgi:hypothetical protein
LKSVTESVLQILMEADVEGLIGAWRHERSSDRLNYRLPRSEPGDAPRHPPAAHPQAAAGLVLPAIPGAATDKREGLGRGDPGSVDRRYLDPPGRGARAGQWVSKLCKDIDERVNAFLERPIEGEWPYLGLDATYLKAREGGRIVSVAAIIAVAVNTDGRNG